MFKYLCVNACEENYIYLWKTNRNSSSHGSRGLEDCLVKEIDQFHFDKWCSHYTELCKRILGVSCTKEFFLKQISRIRRMKTGKFTLLLVNNNSSPLSVFHERTCPPCKLTWIINTKNHQHLYFSNTRIIYSHSFFDFRTFNYIINGRKQYRKGARLIRYLINLPAQMPLWGCEEKPDQFHSYPLAHRLIRLSADPLLLMNPSFFF